MLDRYTEPSLPASVMTPTRRKALARNGGVTLAVVAGALWFFSGGWLLWGLWGLATLAVSGVVLLKPSLHLEGKSPDEILQDYEVQKVHKYMRQMDRDQFLVLEAEE